MPREDRSGQTLLIYDRITKVHHLAVPSRHWDTVCGSRVFRKNVGRIKVDLTEVDVCDGCSKMVFMAGDTAHFVYWGIYGYVKMSEFVESACGVRYPAMLVRYGLPDRCSQICGQCATDSLKSLSDWMADRGRW